MKYLLLVSHGKMADGLKNSLAMLAGEHEEVISCGLENGKSADEFAQIFEGVLEGIPQDAPILMLADLIGGSPMTTAMNVLAASGRLANTQVIGGMNLPLALTAVLMKDTFDGEELAEQILREAHAGLAEFKTEAGTDEDDI